MRYKVNRAIRGDYGKDGAAILVHPGEIIDIPSFRTKSMDRLESLGIVQRDIDRPKFRRADYTVKAMIPPENKSIVPERFQRKQK